MKNAHYQAKFFGTAVASFVLFFGTFIVHSAPLWETDFGNELTDLTGEDEETTSANLALFDVPFNNIFYDDIFIGTNGGLQLGGLGNDFDLPFNVSNSFDLFIADNAPSVHPFSTDLDLSSGGKVHFKEFSNRAVVTWVGVGSFADPFASFTFQTQLLESGQIIMAWNGIPGDLQTDLDQGIVIGITTGDDPDPGTNHFFADAPFSGGTTIYEIWCFDDISSCDSIDGDQENPTSGFPLDGHAVTFTPLGPGGSAGYDVALHSLAPAPVPEPGTLLLLATGFLSLAGYHRFKRR